MKKFHDLKGPLAMLKIKMTMKAQTSTEYTIFAEEITSIINEQDKFIVALEWLVATAEATDPVQVIVFLIKDPLRCSELKEHGSFSIYVC